MLFGSGFILIEILLRGLIGKSTVSIVRPYENGRDLTDKPRGVYLIDTYGFSKDNLRDQHPEIYQWLLVKVKPERDQNKDRAIRENYGCTGDNGLKFVKLFTRPTALYRHSRNGQASHLPVHGCQNCPRQYAGGDCPRSTCHPGACSPAASTALWALAAGGTLEDRPRYNKTLL